MVTYWDIREIMILDPSGVSRSRWLTDWSPRGKNPARSYSGSQLFLWNKVTFYQAHNRVLFSNGHDLMIKWRNRPPAYSAYLQPALITANTLPPHSARTFVLTLCKFCKRAGSMLIMTLFVIWTLQQQSELAFFSGVWSELLLRTNGNIFRCPERAGGG